MFLTAKDGVKIACDWYPTDNPVGYLILLHMMPATKESWRALAQRLQKENYASLALDLRGHGQSEGGPAGYQKFSDVEHQKSILDLAAAADFLKDQGVIPEKIIFIGASIGANLALQYIAENKEFKTAVLLSPGLNYRGIKTEPLMEKFSTRQKIMFVAAQDDTRSGGNSVDICKKLAELASSEVIIEMIFYETGGHGTEILENHPDLTEKIIKFIK